LSAGAAALANRRKKTFERATLFFKVCGQKNLPPAFVAALQRKKLYTSKLRPNSLPNPGASGAIDPTS
jgi:hypothetical protein